MKDGQEPSWLQILSLIESQVPHGFRYLFHQTVDSNGDALPIERMRQIQPDHSFRLWAVEGLINQFSPENRFEKLKGIAALPPADFNRWWWEHGLFSMSRGLFIGVVWTLWPDSQRPSYEELDYVVVRDSRTISELAVSSRQLVKEYIEHELRPRLAGLTTSKLKEILRVEAVTDRATTLDKGLSKEPGGHSESSRLREASKRGFELWKAHGFKAARSIAQDMVRKYFPEIAEFTGKTKYKQKL